MPEFYDEARQILGTLARDQGCVSLPAAVGDAITLNAAAINQPGDAIDVVVETGTNPLEIYRAGCAATARGEDGTFNYHVERSVGAQTKWHSWFGRLSGSGTRRCLIHPIRPT